MPRSLVATLTLIALVAGLFAPPGLGDKGSVGEVAANQTQLTYPMRGTTCFALVAITSAGAGYHAVLCGVPGISNLAPLRVKEL